jgi:hypothetical protein
MAEPVIARKAILSDAAGTAAFTALVLWAGLSREWDDLVRLSARRIYPQYCIREIALKVGLREPR